MLNYNYLEHELHGFGYKSKPATVFLRGGIGGGVRSRGGGRVPCYDGGVGESVKQALGSGSNRVEIDSGIEGMNGRNLMEADSNSGR